MAKKEKAYAKGVKWDLSDFYKNINDPQIEKDKKILKNKTDSFNKQYKGTIKKGVTARHMKKLLGELEAIYELALKLDYYVFLTHSTDTQSEDVGKLYQDINEFTSDLSTQIVWVSLDWISLPNKDADKLLRSKELKDHTHHLSKSRLLKPHKLKENEEQLLTRFSQVGSQAFSRLYTEYSSELRYELKIDGETKSLNYEEIVSYLSTSTDRKLLKQVADSLTKTYQENAKLYKFIYNTLLLNVKLSNETRSYKYPQQSTLLSYEVDKKTVDSMTSTVESRYDMSAKYYKAKKKIVGAKSLHEWDRYSPLYKMKERKYTWKEAKEFVLSAFSGFNTEFASYAQKFFDNSWIDAELSKVKESGAFCAYVTPKRHPLIMLNYTGNMKDIETLAHELGHGVHDIYASENNIFQYHGSIAVAEIASVFAEMIVFDKLYASLEDPKEKANLLGAKIQGSFATVFRQNAFYLFESDLHTHRKEKGELGLEEINGYYQKRLQDSFGDGLILTEGHRFWWLPISHFFQSPFYVFTYAFGELLTNSLYAIYKREGESFVKGYTKALKVGGSKPPLEITKMMGVDINDPGFWNAGLDILEGHVDEFISLVDVIEAEK